jgi:hypothetical protein
MAGGSVEVIDLVSPPDRCGCPTTPPCSCVPCALTPPSRPILSISWRRGGACEADCIIIDDGAQHPRARCGEKSANNTASLPPPLLPTDSPAVAHNRRASKRARRAEPVEDDADDVVIVFDGARADGGASGAAGASGGARAASGAAAASGGSWRNRDTRRGGGAGGPRLEDGDLALARRCVGQKQLINVPSQSPQAGPSRALRLS